MEISGGYHSSSWESESCNSDTLCSSGRQASHGGWNILYVVTGISWYGGWNILIWWLENSWYIVYYIFDMVYSDWNVLHMLTVIFLICWLIYSWYGVWNILGANIGLPLFVFENWSEVWDNSSITSEKLGVDRFILNRFWNF